MTDVLTVEEVKSRALDNLHRMGFDTERVKVMYANQRRLRDTGFLVDLDIRGLTMFDVKVSWDLDLGITSGDARRRTKRIRPGRKSLLPDTKLLSIGQRMRTNLARHSQPLSVFPGYRYVPNKAFEAWWEKHQALVDEWNAYKDWLLTDYELIQMDCREDFTRHARDTFAQNPAISKSYSLNQFIQEVVSMALAHFPSKDKIRADLTVHVKPPATFLLESEYQQELLRAQEIRQERQAERLKYDGYARRELARARQAEAEADEAEVKAKETRRQVELEREERDTAIRETQLQIARDMVKDMVNPFAEAVAANRQHIYASLQELATKVQKRGWVHGKEAAAIRSLRDWFEMMDIGDDQGMNQALEALTRTVDNQAETGPGEYAYNTTQVLTAINNVVDVALQEVDELADALTVDEFSMMDI